VRRNAGIALSLAAVGALLGAGVALADVSFGPHDVPTVFFVSKSDDDNRVDYGIRLDARCHPASASPMAVYWREFEDGRQGRVTHGLNLLEVPAYDAADQRVVERRDAGATLSLTIRALRARAITILTRPGATRRCQAEARMHIGGLEATLHHVHLTLGGPGVVQHADVFGATADGREVTERVRR
jgi:hypothetical protein